jgi:uncharacterized membrane protein YdjX (TVP38/TMEM64 family)
MDWFEPLVRQLADLGGWGPVLFVGIYILAAITLAPAFLLTFSAGAVFGLWRGTLLTYVGAVLGASAVYAVAAPAGAFAGTTLDRSRSARVGDAACGRQGQRQDHVPAAVVAPGAV